jgi:hypothetical protein
MARDILRDLVIDEMIQLKQIFKKIVKRTTGSEENQQWNFRPHKRQETCWPPERLTVSQRLCYKQLINSQD